jgi:tRNA(Ile)-lysidine synthase
MRLSLQQDDNQRFEDALAEARQAGGTRTELGERAAALITEYASRVSPGLLASIRPSHRIRQGCGCLCAAHPDRCRRRNNASAGPGARRAPAAATGRQFSCGKTGPRHIVARTRRHQAHRHFCAARGSRIAICQRHWRLDVWDGRYRISAPQDASEMTIAPLGIAAASAMSPKANAPQSLVMSALAAEPALWRQETLAGLAILTNAVAVVAPWSRFLPGFDLAPSTGGTKADRCGNPVPASPCRGHIGV